jgi:hypothetical protein
MQKPRLLDQVREGKGKQDRRTMLPFKNPSPYRLAEPPAPLPV